MGRRNTRIDQEREKGGYGSRSSTSGDGCAHVYWKCKMREKKKWPSIATYGFGTFYFNTGTLANDRSVKCCSA